MLRTSTFRAPSHTSANIAVKYLQPETSWTCTFQKSIVEMYSSWTLLVAGGDKQLYDYIVSHLEAGQKAFKCTICGKVSAHKTNLRKHVENIHFPGLFSYTCKYCPETFPTKNLLNHHVTNSHRSNVSYSESNFVWIKILNWVLTVCLLQGTRRCMNTLSNFLRVGQGQTNVQSVEKLAPIEVICATMLRTSTFRACSHTSANIAMRHLLPETFWTCTGKFTNRLHFEGNLS